MTKLEQKGLLLEEQTSIKNYIRSKKESGEQNQDSIPILQEQIICVLLKRFTSR